MLMSEQTFSEGKELRFGVRNKNMFLSRLPLQENHKCKRLQNVKEVRAQVWFCSALYRGSSNSAVVSRAGGTSLSF